MKKLTLMKYRHPGAPTPKEWQTRIQSQIDAHIESMDVLWDLGQWCQERCKTAKSERAKELIAEFSSWADEKEDALEPFMGQYSIYGGNKKGLRE